MIAIPSPNQSDASTKLSLQALVVWGTWTVMLVGLFAYVIRYGHNHPFYDGWVMVQVLDGRQPVDLEWLWQPHNTHRIPIPKLILTALLTISGWDFRVGMYFNVLLLGALAAALIHVCANIRGRLRYTDAFFPLILMSWGHYEHLLWTWQVTQVSAVALVITLFLVMVRFGTQLDTPARAIAAGLGVTALPLFGVPGLAYAPGFTLWLIVAAALGWRGGTPAARQAALVLGGCAAATAALVVLYFVGYHTDISSEPFDPLRSLASAVAFTAQGLGPAARELRNFSYLIILAICLASGAALLLALRDRDPVVRSRAWAISFFILGFGGLAASAAIARPGLIFPPRYFLMAVPILGAIYFIWATLTPARFGRLAQSGLAVLAVATLSASYVEGLGYGSSRDWQTRAFVADLQRGMPPSELIARHQWAILPHWAGGAGHDELALYGFWALHDHGIGVFKDLAPERTFLEIPVAEVASVRQEAPETLDGPTYTWTLDEEVFIHGVRLSLPEEVAEKGVRDVPAFIHWRRLDEDSYARQQRYMPVYLGETFFIYGSVRELRIEMPSGSTSEPPALTLLIADEHAAAPAQGVPDARR